MSMTAPDSVPVPVVVRAGWKALGYLRPTLAVTACRYLDQIEVSLRPATVAKADQVLGDFCWHLLSCHPEVSCWA